MPHTKTDKGGHSKNIAPNPTVAAWNPGIAEMTVSCPQSNKALMCATIASELRHGMASHYNHPTVYPIPLHLAALIEEYVLPLEELDVNSELPDSLEDGEIVGFGILEASSDEELPPMEEDEQ